MNDRARIVRAPRWGAFLGLGSALVVASLLWFPRAATRAVIGYDDGVYLSSVLAMREGGDPFRDVYSSQGPVFLPLLRLGDLAGFGASWAARVVPMVAGLVLVVVAHSLARRTGQERAAAVAAALVATSGLLLFSTVRIESDAVVAAFSAGAVLAATSPRPRWSVASVVLIGLAIGVKSLMAGPALLAVLWLLSRRYGIRAVPAVAVATATIVLLASVPWGLAEVWNQSVELHLSARRGDLVLGDRLELLAETVWRKDRLIVAIGGVAVVTWLIGLRSRAEVRSAQPDLTVALWIWMGGSVLLVLLHSPIWTQHLTVLTVPAAVLVARQRVPSPIVAVIALALLPAHGLGAGWRLSHPEATPSQRAVVDVMAGIEPADGLIISDEPTLTWLADRVSPGLLVDPSYVRIDAGQLTTAQVAAAATDPKVCAVLRWSGRFDRLVGLRPSLDGYRTVFRAGDRELLLSERCRVGTGDGTVQVSRVPRVTPGRLGASPEQK